MAEDKEEGHTGVEQAGCACEGQIGMMTCKQEGVNEQCTKQAGIIDILIIWEVSSYHDLQV